MAQRRMFSPDIVESEEFLDMPHSSQSLYFHLAMRADDDGFIQPKSVMRTVGANQDDLKVLLAKRFLLNFETGVVVVKHWLIHNMIRKDRYKETRFQKEKNTLHLKGNNAYTDNKDKGDPLLTTKWQPDDNQMAPQVRLGKVRTGGEADASPHLDGRVNTDYSDDDGVDIVIEPDESTVPANQWGKRKDTAPPGTSRLLSLIEAKRGGRFPNRPKQLAAIKRMDKAGIPLQAIGMRWDDMRKEDYWQNEERIPDMASVESSFNTKPPTKRELT